MLVSMRGLLELFCVSIQMLSAGKRRLDVQEELPVGIVRRGGNTGWFGQQKVTKRASKKRLI
jgi:hypothetical protein